MAGQADLFMDGFGKVRPGDGRSIHGRNPCLETDSPPR
jgi:hypothetical protein